MNRFDDLKLVDITLGKDLLLILTGGAAHIGAASLAYPAADGRTGLQTLAVPGHKEHTLTEGLASRISRELGITAVLVMGVHYDGLKPEEIQEISRNTEQLIDEYIAEHKRKSSGE